MVKLDRFAPRELLFYHLVYERQQPKDVVCVVMQIKKSQYYNIKLVVDDEIEKQRRRRIIS